MVCIFARQHSFTYHIKWLIFKHKHINCAQKKIDLVLILFYT